MRTEVSDNPAQQRYELHVDGSLAGFVRYRPIEPGAVALTHAEVDVAYRGQGLGSILVRGVLDDLRAAGAKVVPLCPFVAAYLQQHPEDLDMVAAEHRERLRGGG